MSVLHQVIAAEKGLLTASTTDITVMLRILDKAQLFEGSVREYHPKNEDGDQFAPERVVVQYKVTEVIEEVFSSLKSLYNVTAQREVANTRAVASIVIDDEVIIPDVPAGYLLFLEKRLLDIRTIFGKIPVLDTSHKWAFDESSGLWNTDPSWTNKTRKVEKPLIIVEATDKHPAQAKTVTEDIVVGSWEGKRQSGALPLSEKKKLLARIDALIAATRDARSRANMVDAGSPPKVFEKISAYLLK